MRKATRHRAHHEEGFLIGGARLYDTITLIL